MGKRVTVAVTVLAGALFFLAAPHAARAVPSFARQTGLNCTTCHTAFPQLTPFGRQFKLNGYTESDGKTHLPPLAAMLQAPTFTHTGAGQPGGAATDYARNDNFALNEMGLFYAGRLFGPYAEDLFGEQVGDLLNHVGTFIQGTWDGVGFEWAWDNSEVRIAATTTVGDSPLVYGVYTNNNPTMEDLWNTTPAWGFPFSGSGLAPEAMAAPLIAGGLEQQVMGAGAYAAGYTTLPSGTQRSLGVDPEGQAEIDGGAPYWRLAWSRDSGPHSFEVGTYGLHANTWPGRMKSAGTDDITDIGFDGQYQYLAGTNQVTVLLNFIHEWEQWDASQALGMASHNSDHLWTVTATTSYLYDGTYGGDIQYFHTGGNQDAMLYGTRTGSPETSGWIFQVDYLPFNKSGGPSFWPKSNVKFSLQYVHYQEFDGATSNYDGTGRDASDNDTLYIQAWLAF